MLPRHGNNPGFQQKLFVVVQDNSTLLTNNPPCKIVLIKSKIHEKELDLFENEEAGVPDTGAL